MPNPTVRSSTQGTTTGTTLTINKPTGATVGDVDVLMVGTVYLGTHITDPSGYTLQTTETRGADFNETKVYTRVIDGTEGSSLSVTVPSGGSIGIRALVKDSDGTVDVKAHGGTGTGANQTVASQTTANNNELLVMGVLTLYALGTAGTFTAASGQTVEQSADAEDSGISAGCCGALGDIAQATAGSTGTFTFNNSGTASGVTGGYWMLSFTYQAPAGVPSSSDQSLPLGTRAKNIDATYSRSVYIPLQVPSVNHDFPNVGLLHAKNLDPGYNAPAYIPKQITPPAAQLDTLIGVFSVKAKNFEASYSQSVYIPLQVPHFNYDWPNVGLLKAKNLDPGYNGTIDVPLERITVNMDWPTIQGRGARAKNLETNNPGNQSAIVCLTAAVGASGDDGRWTSGSLDNTLSTITFGNNGGLAVNAFVRMFPAVPAGSTITTAKLTFQADNNRTGTVCNAQIQAVKQANPTAPTTAGDANGRPLTTAIATWNAVAVQSTGVNYDSVDFTSVVQEVVNQAGWASGNAMLIYILDNTSDANAYREPTSYRDTPSKPAVLSICYNPPPSNPVAPGDWPNPKQARAKNHDMFGSPTVYVPIILPPRAVDTPTTNRQWAKNFEASNSFPIYIPLQTPNINTILPTIGRTWAKNHEPGGSWTLYVPPVPIPRNTDFPTVIGWAVRAKNFPSDYSQTVYVPSRNGIYTPYDEAIFLPNYSEIIVLPDYAEETLAMNYANVVVTPIYTSNADLPSYYSIRRI